MAASLDQLAAMVLWEHLLALRLTAEAVVRSGALVLATRRPEVAPR